MTATMTCRVIVEVVLIDILLSMCRGHKPKISRWNYDCICCSARGLSISGCGGYKVFPVVVAILLFPVIGRYRSRRNTRRDGEAQIF